jgi:hypothetical protein
MPVIVKEVSDELPGRPVLVTTEYSVVAEVQSKFVKAMHQYARVRRRDGAYERGIYRDIEAANRETSAQRIDSQNAQDSQGSNQELSATTASWCCRIGAREF